MDLSEISDQDSSISVNGLHLLELLSKALYNIAWHSPTDGRAMQQPAGREQLGLGALLRDLDPQGIELATLRLPANLLYLLSYWHQHHYHYVSSWLFIWSRQQGLNVETAPVSRVTLSLCSVWPWQRWWCAQPGECSTALSRYCTQLWSLTVIRSKWHD